MGCGSSVNSVVEPKEVSSEAAPQHEINTTSTSKPRVEEKQAINKSETSKTATNESAKDDQSKEKNNQSPSEDNNYPELTGHKNVLSKILTHSLYNSLSTKSTSFGFTIDKAIQPGVDTNLKGNPGCVAGDEESYNVFSPLFDEIILVCHNGYQKEANHIKELTISQNDVTFNKDYVISCNVSIVRNIRGFALPPQSTRAERRTVEDTLIKALGLQTTQGKYYPFHEDDESEPDCVKATKERPTSFWFLAASLGKDWPDARGIYHLNDDFNSTVDINIQDHLKIASSCQSTDVTALLETSLSKIKIIEDNLKADSKEFMSSDHLGYITTCPSQLGTGIQLGAELRLPRLAKDKRFISVLTYLGLSESDNTETKCKVEMKSMLGISEAQQVQNFVKAINSLIKLEKKLSKTESIRSLVKAVKKSSHRKQLLGYDLTDRKIGATENYPDFSKHSNMMSKVLTKDMYERLLNKRTSSGFTIDDVIHPGVIDPGSLNQYGCIAGDEQCYELFEEFYTELIKFHHEGLPMEEQPLECLDASLVNVAKGFNTIISSCSFEAVRNISGFPMSPLCTRAERREVESIVVNALDSMGPPFQGKYISLSTLTNEEVRSPFIFDVHNSTVFQSAKMGRDWPDARGAWHTDDKSFFVWINRVDHARFFAMEKGGDVKSCYSRFCQGLTHFNRALNQQGHQVMMNKKFGYLTTEPYTLGTTLRCTVRLKLPIISQLPELIKNYSKSKFLGFSTAHGGEYLEVSNMICFGQSETTLVQKMINVMHVLAMTEAKFANDREYFESAKRESFDCLNTIKDDTPADEADADN